MGSLNHENNASGTSNMSTMASTMVHAASAPIWPVFSSPTDAPLKPQISAPSYFFSLKENGAPPFQKPEKESRPIILIGTIMTENEVVEMIAAGNSDNLSGIKEWLGRYLVEKKIILNFKISEKRFLISLITEMIDYAAQRDFSAFKLSVFITIYLASHLYFKWYYWMAPATLWAYFKELMIRHTIEDTPDGQEVFTPEECYDILSHFHTVYLSNLPLVHIVTFGVYRIKLRWPFKTK